MKIVTKYGMDLRTNLCYPQVSLEVQVYKFIDNKIVLNIGVCIYQRYTYHNFVTCKKPLQQKLFDFILKQEHK